MVLNKTFGTCVVPTTSNIFSCGGILDWRSVAREMLIAEKQEIFRNASIAKTDHHDLHVRSYWPDGIFLIPFCSFPWKSDRNLGYYQGPLAELGKIKMSRILSVQGVYLFICVSNNNSDAADRLLNLKENICQSQILQVGDCFIIGSDSRWLVVPLVAPLPHHALWFVNTFRIGLFNNFH